VTKDVNEALQIYRFDDAANRILRFLLGRVLRLVYRTYQTAPRWNENNEAEAAKACANLVKIFEASLRLLHL